MIRKTTLIHKPCPFVRSCTQTPTKPPHTYYTPTHQTLTIIFSDCNDVTPQKKQDKSKVSVHQYCADQVRRYDREGHAMCMLLPVGPARKAYFAVRAWNIEVTAVKDLARDANAGQLRLAWWRLTIKEIFKHNPPETPVAKALAEAVQEVGLSRTWFTKILDRREQELFDETIRTVDDLEAFTEGTTSSLFYLALECMKVKNITADHAASHLGKAWGIATILKGTPYHASKRQCYLPLNLLAQYGVSQEALYRGEVAQSLRDVVYDISSIAKVHLDKSRTFAKEVPKQAIPALIPAVMCDDYLKRLQRAHFNPFDPKLTHQPNPLLFWKLLTSSWFNKY